VLHWSNIPRLQKQVIRLVNIKLRNQFYTRRSCHHRLKIVPGFTVFRDSLPDLIESAPMFVESFLAALRQILALLWKHFRFSTN
jgi:hypothetical protein